MLQFKGSLAFHCNNEPLLDERLGSLIQEARQVLKENFFYMYTNGILITADLANDLFKAGLNKIIINNYSMHHELLPSIQTLLKHSDKVCGDIVINRRLKNEYMSNRAGENPSATSFLKKPLNVICPRPLTEMIVGYDGSVPLCCADALWKVTMGNVTNASLHHIWFSDIFTTIRTSLLAGDRTCTEICKVCDGLTFPQFI